MICNTNDFFSFFLSLSLGQSFFLSFFLLLMGQRVERSLKSTSKSSSVVSVARRESKWTSWTCNCNHCNRNRFWRKRRRRGGGRRQKNRGTGRKKAMVNWSLYTVCMLVTITVDRYIFLSLFSSLLLVLCLTAVLYLSHRGNNKSLDVCVCVCVSYTFKCMCVCFICDQR